MALEMQQSDISAMTRSVIANIMIKVCGKLCLCGVEPVGLSGRGGDYNALSVEEVRGMVWKVLEDVAMSAVARARYESKRTIQRHRAEERGSCRLRGTRRSRSDHQSGRVETSGACAQDRR